jgi:hypothetical protein
MRAGPLSNRQIIDLLNRSFVSAERSELLRIQRESYARKLSVGTVHA